VRRLIAVTLILTSCAGSTRTLAGALDTIPGEVGDLLFGLERALRLPAATPEALVDRINPLNATATAGLLYDQVTRVDDTAVEEGVARYTAFVGDLLLAAGDLNAALAAADRFNMALAWLRIEASAGSLAVGLEPEDCPTVASALTLDLCRPESSTDYDSGLEATVRRFLGRYRPVMRLPAVFDDAVQGRIAVVVAPEVIASIDDALGDLAALSPPDSHSGVHAAFVNHLVAIRSVWLEVVELGDALRGEAPLETVGIEYTDPTVVDIGPVSVTFDHTQRWLILEADLIEAACTASIEFVAARVTLRAAEPTSPIAALGALWLYGEGTGCP
jgi:hypothetical protein